jgi:hypothetical protein
MWHDSRQFREHGRAEARTMRDVTRVLRPHRSRRTLRLAVVATLLMGTAAACGGDAGSDAEVARPDDAATSAPSATATSAAPTSAADPAGADDEPGDAGLVVVDGLRGERYCEILAVTEVDGTNIADVYNTIELNDCPAESWDALDTGAVATDLGVTIALRNGPRYWAIDQIEKQRAEGEIPITSLDGLEMRAVATVDVGPSLADAATRYEPRAVSRATIFTWRSGQEVYELTDDAGTTYVLQAWSQQVDPSLEEADLAGLGDRLDLPDGWSFSSRVLTEDLALDTLDEPARVLQDDLGNSYSTLP